MSDSDSTSVVGYTSEEAATFATTTPESMSPEPPEPIADPEAILDPESASDSESSSGSRVVRSVSEAWSEIESTWRDPVIAVGRFREERSWSESALWLQDTSLLDLFLQADQALPKEQQIMSTTKLRLRALREGDDYTITLTAPMKAVGLFSFSWEAGGWHGTLPSHSMTATLDIRARGSRSQDEVRAYRKWLWPKVLVADLGSHSLADRQTGAAYDRTAQDLARHPFRFPWWLPLEPSHYTVKLSAPAIFMFFAGAGRSESEGWGSRDPGSFSTTIQLSDYHFEDRWKFSFEESDAQHRSGYNEDRNKELMGSFGHLKADVKLHLDFEAYRTATESDQETAQSTSSV